MRLWPYIPRGCHPQKVTLAATPQPLPNHPKSLCQNVLHSFLCPFKTAAIIIVQGKRSSLLPESILLFCNYLRIIQVCLFVCWLPLPPALEPCSAQPFAPPPPICSSLFSPLLTCSLCTDLFHLCPCPQSVCGRQPQICSPAACLSLGLVRGRGGSSGLLFLWFKPETWGQEWGKMLPSHLNEPYVTSFYSSQNSRSKCLFLIMFLFRLILKSVHILSSHINQWLDTRCQGKSSLGFKHLPQIVLELALPQLSAWPPGKAGTRMGLMSDRFLSHLCASLCTTVFPPVRVSSFVLSASF